jgi:hypothetical protein
MAAAIAEWCLAKYFFPRQKIDGKDVQIWDKKKITRL